MINTWLKTALRADVRNRAIMVCLLVGTILVAINQGSALLAGQFSAGLWIKIGLTYLVPYGVSTFAAVQAIRD